MNIKNTILGMDVGNTNVHWGYISDGNVENYTICNHTEISLLPWDEIKEKKYTLVLASVFPYINNVVKTFAEKYKIKFIELETETQKIIKNVYPTLGIDRICDLAGAINSFKNLKSPVVTFNFGTATTISACDENNTFLGGVIRAGFELELRSMTTNTLSLPHVRIERESKIKELNALSLNTESAILHGVIMGQVGIINLYLERFKEQTGKTPKVILTGGNSNIIAKHFNDYDLIDNELTLKGVYYCFENSLAAV